MVWRESCADRSRMSLSILALLVGIGSLVGGAVVVPAVASATDTPEPAEIREILDDFARRHGVQTELPERDVMPNVPVTAPFSLPVGFILWVFLALVVVMGLALLMVWALDRFRRPPPRDTTSTTTKKVNVSRQPLGDAARLAGEGRFDEAIHVLLLRTIEELRESLDYAPSPSMTSREILAKAPVPTLAKEALGGLIAQVEWSHFGGRPVGQPDYEQAVTRFERFLSACRGEEAA